MPLAKGQWVAREGATSVERVIPVRIACTKEQIEAIMDLTAEYYEQKAVMAYQISNECLIKEYA